MNFVADEQEYLRIGIPGGYFPSNEDTTINSVIDDATVHELYLWPFAEGVRAGAGHLMTSYNKINGTLASESHRALIDLLKVELNAHSSTLSDWGAAYNTLEAAKNGLDFVEGGAPASNIFGANLGALIKNGTLPKDIIDDKIVRMLTPYFALDQKKLPPVDITRKILNNKSKQVVLDIAEESITLLKNARTKKDKRGLPLEKPTDILGALPHRTPLFDFALTSLVYPRSCRSSGSSWTLRHRQQLVCLPLFAGPSSRASVSPCRAQATLIPSFVPSPPCAVS